MADKIFKLDPNNRETEGELVERYLTALGYRDDVKWNEFHRKRENHIYIRLNLEGDYSYFQHDCDAETFEPVPTPYQVAVAEHMATAPQELAEYVRGRLKESDDWRKGLSPVFTCGFPWFSSVEREGFWDCINTQRWKKAMATDFWKRHTAPSEAPSERPRGVIGQWYTLLTDFNGFPDRKAGYTWQCDIIHGNGEPKIDNTYIGIHESYRLATPEEIKSAIQELHPNEDLKQETVMQPSKADSYSDKIAQVYDDLREKQLRKNADYGDSAFQDIMVGGHKVSAVDACVARMSDKLKRLNSTTLTVNDESFQDTLDDLVGYIVIFKILNSNK